MIEAFVDDIRNSYPSQLGPVDFVLDGERAILTIDPYFLLALSRDEFRTYLSWLQRIIRYHLNDCLDLATSYETFDHRRGFVQKMVFYFANNTQLLLW